MFIGWRGRRVNHCLSFGSSANFMSVIDAAWPQADAYYLAISSPLHNRSVDPHHDAESLRVTRQGGGRNFKGWDKGGVNCSEGVKWQGESKMPVETSYRREVCACQNDIAYEGQRGLTTEI